MAEGAFEGGCLCGATRYAVQGPPVTVTLCHCGVCRRGAGAPMVAWSMFSLDGFKWTGGEASMYASSKGVQRGFCGRCGTTLTWTGDILPGLIDITVGSMDDPAALPPLMHIWDSSRVPWLAIDDGLPRHAGFPPQL